jgi:hypothetical protein
MARTAITVNVPSTSGLLIGAGGDVAGDTVNGNQFLNDGSTFLLVRNTDVSNPHTITFKSPGSVDGTAIPDVAVTIPTNTVKWFGPFPPRVYNAGNAASGSDAGFVNMDINSATLFLQCFRIPNVT